MNNSLVKAQFVLFRRHSATASVLQTFRSNYLRLFSLSSKCNNMSVKEGDAIPNVILYENTPTNEVDIGKLCCQNKKVIIFAVPGAFTPGCSKTHLPSYLERYDELKKCGVNEIVCVSVNDPFVMGAWGQSHQCTGKIRMLADTNAKFTKSLDLAMEIPMLGGIRSKRYSMVVENGRVSSIQVEPDGTGLSCSLAQKLKI